MSCEAQQNPMPSDTKEGELHAIMAPFLGSEDTVDQSPTPSGDALMSPEYSTASDTDHINSPPSDSFIEYSCELEQMSHRLTPPPPYPGTASTSSYHADLNTFTHNNMLAYDDYDQYAAASNSVASASHSSHHQDAPCYQDLVPVSWSQASSTWQSLSTVSTSFRQSTQTLEEFDLSFLSNSGDYQQSWDCIQPRVLLNNNNFCWYFSSLQLSLNTCLALAKQILHSVLFLSTNSVQIFS